MTGKWQLLLFSLSLTSLAQLTRADQLIEKNRLSAGEDLYLIENSVRSTEDPEIYLATYYYRMYEAQSYLEIFDDDFNVIGKNEIGNYRSYAFYSGFDCKKNTVADVGMQFFSTDRPSRSHLIYTKMIDLPFLLGGSKKLISSVCAIGKAQ
jgi:hypothetical protein